MAEPAESVKSEDQKDFIAEVCDALDVLDIPTSADPGQAVSDYVTTRGRTAASYKEQARQLADNLAEADSSADQAAILGKAALCQWAAS